MIKPAEAQVSADASPAPAGLSAVLHGRADSRPLSLAEACALACLAGAAVMMLEVLAFRLVSRYLGTSHYTVTAIIGSVLGGLAIGNYVGGLLADREPARSLLARVFVLASAACFLTPVVNAFMGDWSRLWYLAWPHRIGVHVLITFAVPAACLGAISPVAAKAALETGRARGRILGDVYAWGTLGCILGTFATGFLLIEWLGLYVAGYAVSLALGVVAVALGRGYWLGPAWLAGSVLVLLLSIGPWPGVRERTADLGLRDVEDADILFHRDSAYSQVRVVRDHERPGQLVMLLDKLKHSQFDPARPDELMYGYERIYAAVTAHARAAAGGRDDPRVLILGGGGYTHPRDILRRYPGAALEVVEIDPVVTQAAKAAFGLADDERMKIVHLDARQHVADLHAAGTREAFDFVFLDAVNDFNVPYHLATREFQSLAKGLMRPAGVFMITLIDILDEGRLLAAMVRTTRENFNHVAVFYSGDPGDAIVRDRRATFVIVAADRDLNLPGLGDDVPYGGEARALLLPPAEIDAVLNRTRAVVLTDDYSPVEQLLAGVVQRAGADVELRFYHRADVALRRGRFEQAIRDLNQAAAIRPDFSLAWLNLGICYFETGRLFEAEQAFGRAAVLMPDSPAPLRNLGQLYFSAQMFGDAAEAYAKAAALDPSHARTQEMLGKSLGNAGRHREAAAALEKALSLDPENAELARYLELARELARREPTTQPATPQASETQPGGSGG